MKKPKKRVCVIGHFAFGKDLFNGQTIKTKIITQALTKNIGEDYVLTIDTHGGTKKIFSQIFQTIKSLHKCKNIIILPAHNGVRVFAPVLTFFNKLYNRKLHYIVIGGWLPVFLKKRKQMAKQLMKFDYIYVETSSMKKALEKMGFSNVVIMPNCKDLEILTEEELVYNNHEPYKLCTFSRVMKEKGIENAIDAVTYINEKYGRTIYKLDIYGQVDEGYKERFSELIKTFPEYVSYKGCVEPDKSTDVIKDYYVLLFPTGFYTEGIPGTIIDAFAAGVPVISSKWENFDDVIDDGVTGIGYDFNNDNELVNLLEKVSDNSDIINEIKINCIKRADKYIPKNALDILFGNLND